MTRGASRFPAGPRAAVGGPAEARPGGSRARPPLREEEVALTLGGRSAGQGHRQCHRGGCPPAHPPACGRHLRLCLRPGGGRGEASGPVPPGSGPGGSRVLAAAGPAEGIQGECPLQTGPAVTSAPSLSGHAASHVTYAISRTPQSSSERSCLLALAGLAQWTEPGPADPRVPGFGSHEHTL